MDKELYSNKVGGEYSRHARWEADDGMRRKPQQRPPAWKSFSVERAVPSPIAAAWIANNFVNATVPGAVTQYELVQAICASVSP